MLSWRGRERGAKLVELEAVYRQQLGELRRVAAAIIGDREVARDVVQDAFVTAVRQRGRFRGEGPIEAWVWRIVVNQARDAARTSLLMSEIDEYARVADNGHAGERSEHVRAALAALPERQRLILFLRYYADLDYGTIATIADVAPGTVGATLSAGRRALRRLVEEVPA